MRHRLLLYLASSTDAQRVAVGPVLAGLAQRQGWLFECYYDAPRRGLHFGSGDPAGGAEGVAGGSLVAGGRHLEQLTRLAVGHHVVALGDPESVLWPALAGTDAEVLSRSTDPAVLFAAAFARLGEPLPVEAYVLDDSPQGVAGIRTAPYLAPALLSAAPALAVEASAEAASWATLTAAGVTRWRGLWLDAGRAAALSVELDEAVGDASHETYASFTATVARGVQTWGEGVFLGDPDLVAAQLGRIAGRRLTALYGRPHVDVIERVPEIFRAASEPVFGRQYDDRDFIELAPLGHGLHVVDPDPPFESARHLPVPVPVLPPVGERDAAEPSDGQLSRWADEGRVLVTLCLWAGMVREVDGLLRLLDLAALTGVHAGLVVTAETVELQPPLELLSAPTSRGGLGGRIELLLGSTGRGVAAEGLLPPGVLERHLREARAAVADRLPADLVPRGWWPLLDTGLRRGRPTVLAHEGLRPVVHVPTSQTRNRREDLPGTGPVDGPDPEHGSTGSTGPRRAVGNLVRGAGLDRFVVPRRPFAAVRPAEIDDRVLREVEAAGFTYMWTKAGFGSPRIVGRHGQLVALPFTAGNWDGWSPFYTVGTADDVARAERRLLRSGRPGWLASTVDSPLFALSGEIWRHGGRLHDLVRCVADGGRSGRLINVRPHVVARYARLLDRRSAAPHR